MATASTTAVSPMDDTLTIDPDAIIPVPEIALLLFTRLLGDEPCLQDTLGLNAADLYHLKTLPSESLARLLAQLSRNDILEVRFRRDALRSLLHHLQTDGRAEKEIRSMIEAEASHPFMKHFYDLSYPLYHQYRQRAGLLRPVGRPSTPKETVSTEITALLQKLDLLSPTTIVGPFDLLAVHQLTGYPLRDVWSVYQSVRESESFA